MIKNLSIRNKILFSTCAVFLVVFASTIGFLVSRVGEMSKRQANQTTEEMAGRYASSVKAEVELAMDASRALAKIYEGAAKNPEKVNRDLLDAQLKEVLLSNPLFFGAWVLFEPNALDGRDADFLNYNETHDGTGRYGIYHFWEGKEVVSHYAAPEEGEEPGDTGDWYQIPKKTVRETLNDPYKDSDNGHLMSTTSVPILKDGVFIGAVGIDIALNTFQDMVSAIKPFGTGYGFLVANNGEVLAHPDAKAVGKTIDKVLTERGEKVLRAVKEGKELQHLERDRTTGETFLQIYKPITIGSAPTPWSFAVAVPMSQILSDSRTLAWQAAGMGALAMMVLIALVFIAASRISAPIRRTEAMLRDLEHGHLDRRLDQNSGDEIGRMARALNAFADNLQQEVLTAFEKLAAGDFTFEAQGVIREPLARANSSLNDLMVRIRGVAGQIAAEAAQVSDTSQSLSQGATEQASSLEEIAASMHELASQTKLNAGNAAQANHLSAGARQSAEEGNRQMQEMVTAMAEINEAGQSISRIIKTIDEIAFQTNLLALNAAVEAARAGHHGKGFAVVAEEVRNLAARSAKAARETADLIERSVAKTENGARIARQTAEALQSIVSAVSKASELVGEIAAASHEQAEGLSQIHIGLSQVDQVTQQNTANAEEGAAASEELSAQAGELAAMLQRFRLREHEAKFLPRIR